MVLAFSNATALTMHKQMNNVTMHKTTNDRPGKVESNQTSELQSFLS